MAAMAGSNGNRVTRYCFKGQKMMITTSEKTTIIDFYTQTVTTVNDSEKKYAVKKFSEVAGAGANVAISLDVRDGGQTKLVNGFNARETIFTMGMDMDGGRGGPPMKMQMETEMWVSSDVEGAREMRAFYRTHAANFPWAAMTGSGVNQNIQRALAQIQRKLADLDGTVVEQIIRIKPTGGTPMPQMSQAPQMTPAQQAQMQAAMAQMQAMAKQGGQNAAAAQQAMAAMAVAGTMPGAGGDSLIEITVDSSGFSTAEVPASDFVVPAGYKQIQ
jgi:hypothetical protein